MKKFIIYRPFLYFLAGAILLGACRKHDEEKTDTEADLSVLIYIAAENDLSWYYANDLKQMMEGSKKLSDRQNLLLFVDLAGQETKLIKVAKGDTTCMKTFDENLNSSDAETLRTAMEWTMTNYKAKNYGLVLWGHADGWIIENSRTASSRRKAYGLELHDSRLWMDIPDMARALESLPREGNKKPLKFIFADCCCFQSVESDYELRQCADYIIGSAAEIPGEGAPYQTVIPALFSTSDNFYVQVVDAYFAQVSDSYRLPMSVVKTSEMDNLAEATRTMLSQHATPIGTGGYPKVDNLIYYYCKTLFDMNDFMLSMDSENDYRQWRQAFDKAVPYSTMTLVWMAQYVPYRDRSEATFQDFDITPERYGGVSMFVPQDPQAVSSEYKYVVRRENGGIQYMQWYKATGLDALGW